VVENVVKKTMKKRAEKKSAAKRELVCLLHGPSRAKWEHIIRASNLRSFTFPHVIERGG
jgi:hypothetical protein